MHFCTFTMATFTMATLRKLSSLSIIIIATAVVAAGCGQKGALYIPEAKPINAPSTAKQVE